MIEHRFVFKNMNAGANLEQFANGHLGALMRTAPYSATSDAVLELTPAGFKAVVKVQWGVQALQAQFSHPDVQTCLQRVFANLRSELSKWRRDRILKSSIQPAGALGPILKKRKPD